MKQPLEVIEEDSNSEDDEDEEVNKTPKIYTNQVMPSMDSINKDEDRSSISLSKVDEDSESNI